MTKDSNIPSNDTIKKTPKFEPIPSGDGRIVFVMFAICGALMGYLIMQFPNLTPEEKSKLVFPTSVDKLKLLNSFLQDYKINHADIVFLGFCSAYLFLQTFAIPGPIFLSILAGSLYGVVYGLIVVSFCATTGATLCYLLSYYLGRSLIEKYFPQPLTKFRRMVEHHRDNLFYYMVFLRISPALPNVFVNIASPILHVPVSAFFFGTFLGLIPANYIHVTTGLALGELTSIGDINIFRFLSLFLLAFIALIPTFFRKKFRKIVEVPETNTQISNSSLKTKTQPNTLIKEID